jgi:hypothetical protein
LKWIRKDYSQSFYIDLYFRHLGKQYYGCYLVASRDEQGRSIYKVISNDVTLFLSFPMHPDLTQPPRPQDTKQTDFTRVVRSRTGVVPPLQRKSTAKNLFSKISGQLYRSPRSIDLWHSNGLIGRQLNFTPRPLFCFTLLGRWLHVVSSLASFSTVNPYRSVPC